MIILAILAALTGIINIWLSHAKETLEARVNYMISVVVFDFLFLLGFEYITNDPMMGIFMCCKYLFLAMVDFDKALRIGLK